jgi:endonuclease G
MLLGNPSNAAAITDSSNNYLMVRTYYDISYNSTRGTPNWVSWHLYTLDLGSTDRLNDFRADVTLPPIWYQVQNSSYTNTGFNRGHNCPSGDRTASTASNSATFLMTNMIPQAPYNNQQTWKNLEDFIRKFITNDGYEAYIIMGSYGIGGTGANGYAETIDNGQVTVPSNIWKVIVLIPNGDNDLARIDANTRVIAVNAPNENTVSSDWKQYITTVNDIENETGYKLLSNVPETIRQVLKAKKDSGN